MAISCGGWYWHLGLASLLAMGGAIAALSDCAHAQVTPDVTLGAESSVVTPTAPGSPVNVIDGGATRGANLFHSFEQFSVPTGGEAFFNNAVDIQNIIGRVSGGSLSNIDGLLRANGTANLFLLNPNGIVFGPNATLNIGGSFVGSTASSLNFADGTQFSATNPQSPPLLTVSVPIGLQFGGTAGGIRVQEARLEVQPGTTLALVGSGLALEGSTLIAQYDYLTDYLTREEGRIELGSVGSSSLVSLLPTDQGWTLGYEGVQNFQDIQLSPGGLVPGFNILKSAYVSGGNMQVRGRQVTLTGNSSVGASASNVVVAASESVELSDKYTSLSSDADLTITTGKLIVRNGASMEISEFPPSGSGTNLTVNASESVEVIGTNSKLSTTAQFRDKGAAGNLTITTGTLIVQDGAEVSTSKLGSGDASDLIIRASDSVEVSGGGRILAETDRQSTGPGGNLTIETKRLQGTQVAVRSLGQGPAGTLTITTQEPLPNLETQIVPDETLPTRSTVSSNFTNSTIEGGTQVGSNLFHSFAQFSLPTLSTAYFNNALDIQNIIARVTGSSVSDIDGLIRTNGTANLFLLNPNGIIFGSDTLLNIGGSILASTTSNLNFADGTQFSATAPQATPLLTVSVPIGVEFWEAAGDIRVQGGQLAVQTSRNLTLVGSNVSLTDGASLSTSAPSGTRLSQEDAGSVSVQANGDVSFVDSSISTEVFSSFTEGGSGDISVQANGNVSFVDSTISSSAGGEGKGGDIHIQARSVSVTDEAQLLTATNASVGSGNAGNIQVDATDSVTLSGALSGLFTSTNVEPFFGFRYDSGQGGDITVRTGALRILDGAILNASTRTAGDGGNITVNVNTLESTGGGQILTTAFNTGDAGNITVNATDSINLSGSDPTFFGRLAELYSFAEWYSGASPSSGILANTLQDSSGRGGSLRIETGRLNVRDGAEVNVSSAGAGAAGDLTVEADSIRLDNGSIGATTTAGQGNINLRSGDMVLRRGSNITTNATGTATGGNINIDTGVLAALENSDITANAEYGFAGQIIINALGIFGTEIRNQLTPLSDITAFSLLEPQASDTLEIDRLEFGRLIALPAELVDVSNQIAQGCPDAVWRGESKFIITGRGGLPPSPTEPLRGDNTLTNWSTLEEPEVENRSSAAPSTNSTIESAPTQIVEANGWVKGPNGEITLVATAPTANIDIPWLPESSCNAPKPES